MKKKIIFIVLGICVVTFVAVVIASASGALDKYETTTDIESSTSTTETTTESTTDSGVLHGELLSVIDDEDGLAVVKVKISKSYSKSSTIAQNYFNVSDLIKNRGFDKYTEIQYWAVADMNDGSEQKVISFTLDKDTIQAIANNEIVDNQIGDYSDDLWVHPSLN
ncbi:MAG: hypothetical protein MR281_05440 [Eubacterium sp.]|nr:hypothetical protein [Eubacterium sp.]